MINDKLLQEWIDYGENKATESKARRIVLLCLRRKKYDLAEKIGKKYNLNIGNDDFINASCFALMCLHKTKPSH